MLISSNHILLHLSKEFAEICQPLALFNINHLTFVKQYRDSSRITLCNKPNWLVDYYNLQLFDSSLFEKPFGQYPAGHSLWLGEYNLDVYRHGRQYYNTSHSITVTEPVNDGCEFYFFSLPHEHMQSAIYLSNHMEVLYHFIVYFKDKGKKLLQKAEGHRFKLIKNKLVQAAQEIVVPEANLFSEMEKKKAEFVKRTPVRRFVFESGEFAGVHLTQREILCVIHLLENKTAEETSISMGVSRRTVESYLDNIKLKMGCTTKYELMTKLRNNKLFLAVK